MCAGHRACLAGPLSRGEYVLVSDLRDWSVGSAAGDELRCYEISGVLSTLAWLPNLLLFFGRMAPFWSRSRPPLTRSRVRRKNALSSRPQILVKSYDTVSVWTSELRLNDKNWHPSSFPNPAMTRGQFNHRRKLLLFCLACGKDLIALSAISCKKCMLHISKLN